MTDRRRLTVVVTSLCVASVAAGVIASSLLRPPEDAIAEAPSEPSRTTAEVGRDVLTSSLVLRGDVVFADAVPVRGFGVDGEVVTAAPPSVGATLEEGDVVLEVAERPVLLLEGAVPMYRDLGPGMSGVDVAQLQEALARLGHYDGSPDGTYDAETSEAVARLFEARGHEPPEPDVELTRQVEQAEETVKQARRSLDRARRTAEAQRTQRSQVVAAESELRRAEGQLEVATLRASSTVGEAETALAEAKAQLEDAERQREDLEESCAQQDQDGASDACDALPDAEEAERAAAQAVRDREAALDLAVLEADLEVQTGEDAVEAARARVAEARAEPGEAQAEVEIAEEELAAAEEALAVAEAGLAAVARRSEVVFVPSAPAQLTAVHAGLGTTADDVLVEISAAQLVVESAVAAPDRSLVEVGQPVEVASEELGISVDGEVAAVADEPGGSDLASHQFRLTISLDDTPETSGLHGLNVRAVVPLANTDGEVLHVPVSALVSTEDQRVRVYAEDEPDGPLRPVVVTPGLTAHGLVEVTPVDGDLAEGDRVVVSAERDGDDDEAREGEGPAREDAGD